MALPAAFRPLWRHPSTSAIFLDFDGTLAPIVEDPALARPLRGVSELLVELAARFSIVAVVSGRPARFLAEHLDHPRGVRLIGLYGLEEVGRPSGPTVRPETLEQWRPIIEALAERAGREAPSGVVVEHKMLAFTLHYRHARAAAPWVQRFAEAARDHDGVLIQPGRMAIELRAGIAVDKGTVISALATGCESACCFGDDLGDLPAFAALDVLARSGVAVVRVAVVDHESPAVVAEAAEIVVEGPQGALLVLTELVAAVSPQG